MKEALDGPSPAGGLQKHMGPEDVVLGEHNGVFKRVVHMGVGSKVQDGVNLAPPQALFLNTFSGEGGGLGNFL